MPRKKSLLIGINYTGSNHQLNGCINDAMSLREYLVRDRGYSPDQRDMVILTDAPENRGTPFYPTGANMLTAFNWLVSGESPGDSLCCHIQVMEPPAMPDELRGGRQDIILRMLDTI